MSLDQHPHVGLFITCLADLFRPSVGFAALKLLRDAGCRVDVPRAQTCCGQPAYNAGDRRDTAAIARQVIDAFEPFDYVVAPSGSCAGMIAKHYPDLFDEKTREHARAQALAAKTHELVQFLADVINVEALDVKFDKTVTYHDSCTGLRELGIRDQPRRLLASVAGLKLAEMEESETCCGFGGMFCVKYADISDHIVAGKTDFVRQTGAEVLLAGDLGCLMNMAGKMQRQGSGPEVRHVAEVLAGMTDGPAIGEADG